MVPSIHRKLDGKGPVGGALGFSAGSGRSGGACGMRPGPSRMQLPFDDLERLTKTLALKKARPDTAAPGRRAGCRQVLA